jgi:hypothetical protein
MAVLSNQVPFTPEEIVTWFYIFIHVIYIDSGSLAAGAF